MPSLYEFLYIGSNLSRSVELRGNVGIGIKGSSIENWLLLWLLLLRKKLLLEAKLLLLGLSRDLTLDQKLLTLLSLLLRNKSLLLLRDNSLLLLGNKPLLLLRDELGLTRHSRLLLGNDSLLLLGKQRVGLSWTLVLRNKPDLLLLLWDAISSKLLLGDASLLGDPDLLILLLLQKGRQMDILSKTLLSSCNDLILEGLQLLLLPLQKGQLVLAQLKLGQNRLLGLLLQLRRKVSGSLSNALLLGKPLLRLLLGKLGNSSPGRLLLLLSKTWPSLKKLLLLTQLLLLLLKLSLLLLDKSKKLFIGGRVGALGRNILLGKSSKWLRRGNRLLLLRYIDIKRSSGSLLLLLLKKPLLFKSLS